MTSSESTRCASIACKSSKHIGTAWIGITRFASTISELFLVDLTSASQEYLYCRKQERKLNSCMFDKLVRLLLSWLNNLSHNCALGHEEGDTWHASRQKAYT